MRIGIDARLISQSGVGTYIANLLYYIENTPGNDKHQFLIYITKSDNKSFRFKEKNFTIRLAPFRWHGINEQLGFYRLLMMDNLDLMHFTYFSYPMLYKRPFIATVHDLTPLYFKTGKASTKNPILYELKHRVFKHVLSSQIHNAQSIITPTHTVKKQLMDYYKTAIDNRVHPLYEGVDYRLQEAKENLLLRKKYLGRFFIYVGNFYPHKNVTSLISAFSQINSDHKLILVGPNDFFSQSVARQINQLSQNEKIEIYSNPTREDFVFFYNNATALIHPSLSEGFGLPLVEAAYFNLPVIASDIAVFKELLGINYLSFNPKDCNDIRDKIKLFISKRHTTNFTYQELASRFSFKKMTARTLALYETT